MKEKITMTENTENLVLEILRRMQGDMADLKAGQRDIQHRLILVETRLAGVERNLADHYAAYAGQSARIDRLEERLAPGASTRTRMRARAFSISMYGG
jgi:hypothetical protein